MMVADKILFYPAVQYYSVKHVCMCERDLSYCTCEALRPELPISTSSSSCCLFRLANIRSSSSSSSCSALLDKSHVLEPTGILLMLSLTCRCQAASLFSQCHSTKRVGSHVLQSIANQKPIHQTLKPNWHFIRAKASAEVLTLTVSISAQKDKELMLVIAYGILLYSQSGVEDWRTQRVA